MVAVILNPYKVGSRSASAIRDALREKGINSFCLQRRPRFVTSILVNWGNSEWAYPVKEFKHVLNPPSITAVMSNKRTFFTKVGHEDIVVPWTTSDNEALEWAKESKVVARHVLEGHSGKGIEIFDPAKGGDFPKGVALYTKYIPKTHEYRVHIARQPGGSVFEPLLIQRKIFKKTEGNEAPRDWHVRSHDNGFIYVVQDKDPIPDAVKDVAILLMSKHFSGMHFAAVDVIYHSKTKKAMVLEGNTAPGLEGQTVAAYTGYFENVYKEITK